MLEWLRGLPARIRAEAAQTFRSLHQPNYLRYSVGNFISLTGTWTQSVALSWLTYNLTGSAWMLALVALCTNVPVLLFSLFGGMVADRYDRRLVLLVSQWIEMGLALTLATLFFTGGLQVWMIFVLSAIQGLVTAIEVPSRQAFVADLVGGNDMVNAISLNSVIFNSTRMLGPAMGAILLSHFGEGICFALNALSFMAAIFTLSRLRIPKKEQAPGDEKKPTVIEGLKVALGNSTVRHILMLTVFTSFFGFQFAFLIPVFVKTIFDGTGHALAVLTSASAAGALLGSLFLASRGKPEFLKRNIRLASLGVALTLFVFAFSTNLWLSALAEFIIGASISIQLNSSNSLLQLSLPNKFRGRVMGVYTMILLGAVPFGSLVIGYASDTFGAPLAVAGCAIACTASALVYVTRKQ
jgi:MFS family permease